MIRPELRCDPENVREADLPLLISSLLSSVEMSATRLNRQTLVALGLGQPEDHLLHAEIIFIANWLQPNCLSLLSRRNRYIGKAASR